MVVGAIVGGFEEISVGNIVVENVEGRWVIENMVGNREMVVGVDVWGVFVG